MAELLKSKTFRLIIKILLNLLIAAITPIAAIYFGVLLGFGGYSVVLIIGSILIIPMISPLLWVRNRKRYLIIYCSCIPKK